MLGQSCELGNHVRASCRQGSIPRSFSFDLMSQQGTEIESICCLVSSFLRRIFTCFYIKKFLTTFRKYHFTLSSLLNALPLSWFTFPALRPLWGPAALPGWWCIGTPAGRVCHRRRPSLACPLLSAIGKDTSFSFSVLQLQFHFCKCKRRRDIAGT